MHLAKISNVSWKLFLLLLVVWLPLQLYRAWTDSVVTDEVPHFAAGYAVLAYGDFRMNPEHPPLVKLLAAVPVWIFDRPEEVRALGPLDSSNHPFYWYDAGIYGHSLLFGYPPRDARFRLFLARTVPICFGLAALLLAFVCTRQISASPYAPPLAAALLALYPEFAGHAVYLTFDVPMMAACAGATWAAMAWWRWPGWKSALLFAGVAAVGSLVKLPVTVFVAIQLLCLLALALGMRGKSQSWRCLALAAMTIVAMYLAQWAGAHFRFSHLPEGAFPGVLNEHVPPFTAEEVLGDNVLKLTNLLWEWRVLPETTLATLAHVRSFHQRPVFFLGETFTGGTLAYFPLTILLKSTLSQLVLMVVLALLCVRLIGTKSAARMHRFALQSILWLPFLLLLILTILSRVNIGHRHVLFIYFPISVAGAVLLSRWITLGRELRLLGYGLIVLHVGSAISAWPSLSTYYNPLVGGRVSGAAYVASSNSDWGQDAGRALLHLREIYPAVNLALYGMSPPQAYGTENFLWINPEGAFPLIRKHHFSPPNPTLPSAISINHLTRMRELYPLYAGEPDYYIGSVAIYHPSVN